MSTADRHLVFATNTDGRYAAVSVVDGRAMSRLNGDRHELEHVRALAEAAPVVTANVARARELLPGALIWDVIELAVLLVPRCPRDSLERVAEFFGIVVDQTGLAGQAMQLQMVFELLRTLLDGLENQILLHVTRLSTGLDWPLRTLFGASQQARDMSPLETGPLAAATPIGAWIAQGATGRRRRADPGAPAPPAVPLDLDEIAATLAPAGTMAAALDGYEPRQEQVIMAQLVADALNSGGQLLIEAGTGTGKSLAYLLPAAMRAIGSQQRAVISTATTTLQDQLFEHDLPLVRQAIASEVPLKASVLKGRNNYLCLSRWQSLLHAGDLSPADRMLLIKTLFWLPQTRTGDRAELHLSAEEEEAWQRVSAVTEACTPGRCTYHRIGVCFLARARRAAEDSHLVVANHALLLSDLVSRSRVLPDYDALILDEAHHLEDEATQQLGWRLGERELLSRLERVWNPNVTSTGAVPEALAVLPPAVRPYLKEGEAAVLQLGFCVRRFFGGLRALLDDPDLMGASGDDSTLRVTAAVRAGSAWQELEQLWSEATAQCEQLERSVVEVIAELESHPGASDAARELASELGGHLDYWRDVRRRLQACVHQPGSANVYWISGTHLRSPWLNAAPIDVSELLRDRLFAASDTSVLVSATLTIGGSFEYVKRRLGLDDAAAQALGSPFDYARAALLYVPNDLPEPNQPGYQPTLERTIVDVVTRLHGRTLVLFTSRAHLRSTYQSLREQLARKGITLLAQGIDESSRTRLLENFRRGSRTVLFGTNAFWEGIDVVGDALSCVMVTRLPFAVPTDPVYAARAEHFDNPFGEYAVPQAVLRLKQGFGRLIRSRTDRGAVVVLDRRIVTRYYGQVFLRSLPECSVKQGPAARAGLEVADWLAMLEPQQIELLQAVPG